MNKLIPIQEPLRSILFLACIYTVGTVGIISPWQEYFLLLTPINLLLTLYVALRPESLLKDRRFIIFALLTWLTGYFVEVLGVHTGVIFGDYSYGKTLGWKVLDVPLMIGVNWLLLTYGAGEIVRIVGQLPVVIKAFLTAAIMVLLDIFIEPVAIQLDFWSWDKGVIPLQNYVAWYVVAFFLAIIYHRLPDRPINQVAVFALILQFVFFILLNITL